MQGRFCWILCAAFLLLALMPALLSGVRAESADFAEPEVVFDSDAANNALIVGDREIYLCGLTPKGSWMKKTNLHGAVLGEWSFSDILGRQPVIQCLAVSGGNILAGLVDSYTQKAAVAVLRDGDIRYIDLPETDRVLLWSMRADGDGMSIISFADTKSQRIIYYSHVSSEGITDRFEAGRSTADDAVIADSFACALQDRVCLLRMTKIDGIVNNCNRELVVFDREGHPSGQALLPSDTVISGIGFDEDQLYLYGFQRLEMSNRAYLACYGLNGDPKWAQAYDSIPRAEYLAVENESIYLAGESEDIPGQWTVCCLDKNGTLAYSQFVLLPEAYQVFWFFQDTDISIIQNFEEKPCLWQIKQR